MIDGTVEAGVYLTRLTGKYQLQIVSAMGIKLRGWVSDIAAKVQQQDYMNTTQGLSPELYATALELAEDLRTLASLTSEAWWVRNPDKAQPKDIVQFMHHCLVMRVHLPFTMQESPSEADHSSRLACMAACKEVAQRYQFLRQKLPSGFMLAHIMDLQVFTASIVLLLTTHGPVTPDLFDFHSDKAEIEKDIAEVVKVMGEMANDVTQSEFARNGATTICSLSSLLQQDNSVSEGHEDLTLNVPLLGRIHIRRNVQAQQKVPKAVPALPEPDYWNSGGQSAPQQNLPLQTNPYTSVTPQTPQDWQWNNFSWSVDNNQDYFFQDALMPDNFDHFNTWPNADTSFGFDN